MRVVHIAGTNAKGSTAEYIHNIISRAEYKCGVFTSPHIFRPNERIRINGEPISDADYEKYMALSKESENEHLFMRWARAAKRYFDNKKVDFAVIEAGIGGKSDITTRLWRADVSLLAKIGIDHAALLGNTVEKIAADKCGIIRENGFVIALENEKSVMEIIKRECEAKNARLCVAGGIKTAKTEGNITVFDLGEHRNIVINSIDASQAQNAAAAWLCAESFGIKEDVIRQALESTALKARMQLINENTIVDGAHNPQAAENLIYCVKARFPNKKLRLLTAVMRDKDAKRIAGILSCCDTVICTQMAGTRALPAEEYAEMFENAIVERDIKTAFERLARCKDGINIVAGSFYLASAVLGLSQSAEIVR